MKLKDVPVKLSRVIIICLIVSVLTGAIVYAALPTMPFTINRGIYPGATSFTVWEEDGTYFAKNAYGVIAYSGSDAAAIINNALTSMASVGGGHILITQGAYYVDEPIVLGASSTYYNFEIENNASIIANSALDRLIDMRAGGFNYVYGGGKFDGASQTTRVIDMNRTTQTYVGNRFENIKVYNGEIGVDITLTDGLYFTNVEFENMATAAVWASNDISTAGLYVFQSCALLGKSPSNIGLDTGKSAKIIMLDSCSFDHITIRSTAKIFITNGYSEGAYDMGNIYGWETYCELTIIGGFYKNSKTTYPNINGTFDTLRIYGGHFESGSSKNIEATCDRWKIDGAPYFDEDGSFETSGTDKINSGSTSATITHGLPYTPDPEDINIYSMQTLGSASYFWVDTITSTTFNININTDAGVDTWFAWNIMHVHMGY